MLFTAFQTCEMTAGFLSIVMPARDAVGTVGDAIESILAQTWRDWELIAVDDGSTDATAEILTAYARRDPRIRVMTTPPLGIARALQVGCAASAGDWIARMDCDDLMHPERLRRQMEYTRQHPEIGVVSGQVRYGGDSPGYAAHVDWLNRLRTHEEMFLRRFVEAPVAHPSVMFRRELLEQHGGYRDGDFPEDYELWLRWMEAGVRFGKVPDEILVWNDPPDRLSRTDPRYDLGRFYGTKCDYLARWLRGNVDPGRELWLWGAGRVTRRRFDPLERGGFRFHGFIDVDAKKANRHRDGRRVVMADALPDRERAFVIVGVGNRGARERITAHLTARDWSEGRDFLLAA
jgi:glycosyltransferase involved in cell wall biosynthesis